MKPSTNPPENVKGSSSSSEVKSFATQVALYKRLAMSAWYAPLPSEKKAHDDKVGVLKELDTALEDELNKFSKEMFRVSADDLNQRIILFTVYMYMIEKLFDIYAVVNDSNKVGLYALFNSVFGSVRKLLETNYFQRSVREVMRDYLQLEAKFVACAEICGVDSLAIQEVVPLYQQELADRLEHMLAKNNKLLHPKKAVKKPAKKSAAKKIKTKKPVLKKPARPAKKSKQKKQAKKLKTSKKSFSKQKPKKSSSKKNPQRNQKRPRRK